MTTNYTPTPGDQVRSIRYVAAGPDTFTRPAPLDGNGNPHPGEHVTIEGPADITTPLPATYSWCRIGPTTADPTTLPSFLRIVTEGLIVDEVDPFGTHGPFTRVWSHLPGGITTASDMDRVAFELIQTEGRLW